MDIPKRIDPCPIIETIIEVRYESETPQDAIFGIVYKELKNDFPKVVKLPILQMPEAIRNQDPNLIFRPHYQLKNGGFLFQIGPKVLGLNNVGEYVGWDVYSAKLFESFDKISKLDIVNKALRVGLRYLNFFDFNIFEFIDLKILMDKDPLEANDMMFRAEIESNGYLNILQITNNATSNVEGEIKKGSMIDIDTLFLVEENDFFKNFRDILEKGHLEEKKLFFELLNSEYLKTLNPQY